MTREEILALEGRELDRAVHQSVFGVNVDAKMYAVHDGLRWRTIPAYSADHNAARLVLAEVERRGKVKEYTLALCSLKGYEPDEYWTPIDIWRMMTATPAQICRAALLSCMEVE